MNQSAAVVMTPEKSKPAKFEMDFDFPKPDESFMKEVFNQNSLKDDAMGWSLAVTFYTC